MAINDDDKDHLGDEFAAVTWRKATKSNNAHTTHNLDNNRIDRNSEAPSKHKSKSHEEHTSSESHYHYERLLSNKGFVILALVTLVGGFTVAIVNNSFIRMELFPPKVEISPSPKIDMSPSPKAEKKQTS